MNSKIHKGSSTKSVKSVNRMSKIRYGEGKPHVINANSIKRVSSVWAPVLEIEKEELQRLLSLVADEFTHLNTHRGVAKGTKRFKDIRTYIIKWVLNLDPAPVPCLSLDKSGFPRDFRFLKKYAKIKHLRILTTLLSISRLSLEMDTEDTEFSSIRSGPNRNDKFKSVISDFSSDLPWILKDLGIRKFSPENYNKTICFHYSNSAGPNSNLTKRRATLDFAEDAKALMQDQALMNVIRRLCDDYQVPWLLDYIELSAQKADRRFVYVCHSRIAMIANPENKKRVVALLDYFSQMLLRPVERMLNKAEQKVSNSFMFNQDLGRDRARQFTITGEPVSLDASDFTDRFPKEIQREVLAHLTNDVFARNIISLLCSRGFKAPGHNKPIWYAAGQPMGAHGSFQLANLTHSLLAIWCACKVHGLKPSEAANLSAVVGDDIVFNDGATANFYQEVMKHLGVEFSEFKGYRANKATKVAEFCKVTYLNGIKVSGFSPRPALNYSKDYKHISSFRNNCDLSDSELVKLVSNTKPSKVKVVSDLLLGQLLYKGQSLRAMALFGKTCSESIKDLVGYLMEGSETIVCAIVNSICFLVYFSLILEQSSREQEKYFARMGAPQREPVPVPGRVLNIFSNSEESKFIKIESTQGISLGKIEDPTTWLLGDLKEERVLTPLGYCFIGGSDADLYSSSDLSDQALDKLTGGELTREIFITEFSDIGSNKLLTELKDSMYGSAAVMSNSLAFESRLDDSGAKSSDKLLFYISKRILRVLNNSWYSDNSIHIVLNDELPPIEIPGIKTFQ